MINKFSSGKIRIRSFSKDSIWIFSTLAVLLVLTVAGLFFLDTKGVGLMEGFASFFEEAGDMFLTPWLEPERWAGTGYKLLITLGLAFLTTILGAVLAIFLGLLAARNLSTPWLSQTVRGIVTFFRAVPTVLWVLIFAIGAGLGSVAAVIGMSFHTISYLTKAYSESYEELDPGVIEALKASGASWPQIIFQAVLPSSASYLLSWTFVRFEINFAVAVAMGAAAGAGGIGFDLMWASAREFKTEKVGFLVYAILVVALILEVLATRMKKRLMFKK
jgi:phosphonate transport system permease protein